MHYEYQIILKRWLPILKEYERTRSKVTPRPFRYVKDLCRAHHISAKEPEAVLCQMDSRWQENRITASKQKRG